MPISFSQFLFNQNTYYADKLEEIKNGSIDYCLPIFNTCTFVTGHLNEQENIVFLKEIFTFYRHQYFIHRLSIEDIRVQFYRMVGYWLGKNVSDLHYADIITLVEVAEIWYNGNDEYETSNSRKYSALTEVMSTYGFARLLV